MDDKVRKVLDCAIDRVNELLPVAAAVSKERQTVLLGPDGALDSMGFVNLLAALTEELEQQLGLHDGLPDHLLSGDGFKTLGDLETILVQMARGGKPNSP